MRHNKLLIFILLLILNAGMLKAQFKLSGELRPRTEYSHGYKSLAVEGQDPSTFTTQRTRLNFIYKDTLFHTKVTLQDVRLWGSQPQLVTNEDFATSVHEAWVEIDLPRNFALKAGRQEVVYDNHRIFGNVGWAQQGRSHDIAIIKYSGDLQVDLGLAYNQNADRTNNLYLGPDAYKAMQYVWVHKNMEDMSVSFLLLNNGVPYTEAVGPGGNVTEQSIKYSQTLGGYVNMEQNEYSLEGNFYYQTGKDPFNRDLSAFEFLISGDYKVQKDLTLMAGYEVLSGTNYNQLEGNNSFTPFYGTNHKFNGYMDYFYVGNHMYSVGLHDLYAGISTSYKSIGVKGILHVFNAYADIAPDTDKYLGVEMDLAVNYRYSDNVSFSAGYSHLFPGESMELLKGGDSNTLQNWAYLMVSVTPTFFSR